MKKFLKDYAKFKKAYDKICTNANLECQDDDVTFLYKVYVDTKLKNKQK